jgi:hypothetical protein
MTRSTHHSPVSIVLSDSEEFSQQYGDAAVCRIESSQNLVSFFSDFSPGIPSEHSLYQLKWQHFYTVKNDS